VAKEEIFVTFDRAVSTEYVAYHMALHYIDALGVEHVIQAGPQNGSSPPGGTLAEVYRQATDKSSNTDSPWGRLIATNEDVYEPPSRPTDLPRESIVSGDNLREKWDSILDAANRLNSEGYEYSPFDQNSNTFVNEALRAAGLRAALGLSDDLPTDINDPLSNFYPIPGSVTRLTDPINGPSTFGTGEPSPSAPDHPAPSDPGQLDQMREDIFGGPARGAELPSPPQPPTVEPPTPPSPDGGSPPPTTPDPNGTLDPRLQGILNGGPPSNHPTPNDPNPPGTGSGGGNGGSSGGGREGHGERGNGGGRQQNNDDGGGTISGGSGTDHLGDGAGNDTIGDRNRDRGSVPDHPDSPPRDRPDRPQGDSKGYHNGPDKPDNPDTSSDSRGDKHVGGRDPGGPGGVDGHGSDYGGGYGRGGVGVPVALDLDGDGKITLVPLGDSSALYDLDGDGQKERVAWVGSNDGFLVADLNGDGKINQANELALSLLTPGADTDLEALAAVFDSNHDGRVNAQDTDFGKLRVWQDANGNGSVESGELKTLALAGLTSIDVNPQGAWHGADTMTAADRAKWSLEGAGLQSDGTVHFDLPDGAELYGVTAATRSNGTTLLVGDIGLSVDPIGAASSLQADGTTLHLLADGSRWLAAAGGQALNINLATTTVAGRTGVDGAIGSALADTIANSGTGPSVVYGGLGNDLVNGGVGDDRLNGGEGADRLTGGDGDDVLHGGAGSDTLQGGVGDDVLRGGAGADILDGGAGKNEASYSSSLAGVSVNLLTGAASGGDAQGDTLTNISDLYGSARADTLTGNGQGNTLVGGRGGDTLGGGDGDDILNGGLDADALVGGTGIDLATYVLSAAAVTVSLNTNTGQGGDAAGDTLSGIENLEGSALNDTLYGNAGDNVLIGLAGNDLLGGDGGDDVLNGGAGADTLSGQGGFDVASYADSAGAVSVDLAAGAANGGDGTGDTLSGIEGMIGSVFNDSLLGDGEDNILHGGTGNDTLVGRAGDDVLHGGAGADVLSGQDGIDLATWFDSTAGVTVSLITNTGQGGDAAGDTLAGIENLEGSAFADQLSGDAGANALFGGAGNDGLYGKEGDDVLNGGAGADALSGWLGFDMASYANSAGQVSVDLAAGAANGGDGTGDTLSGIEGLIGSVFNDSLLGDAGDNVLRGDAGNDTLIGRAGDDVLHGGAGADVLSGQDGIDLATWFDSVVGVTASLITNTGQGGDAAGDTLAGIEDLEGSAFADQLTGDAGANALFGGAGNDGLYGKEGDDILNGGAGADALSGWLGFDMASYANSAGAVSVDLAAGAANGGDGTGDTLSGIEGVIGSVFNDSLLGDAEDNILHGDGGNDGLIGRAGDDILHGGAGADVLSGQDGIDLATWFDSVVGVTVSLVTNTGQGGDAAGDALAGIEDLEGSAFGDQLTGDAGDNTLRGGAGDDGLYGKEGDDVLHGGAGADALSGWLGFDMASYANSAGAVSVDLAAGAANGGDGTGDTLSSIEGVIGSVFNDSLLGDAGGNVLRGDAGNDTLIGRVGDDVLHGGAGADVLSGQDGIDLATWFDSAAGVTVSLITNTGQGGDAAGDTLAGIENLEGSDFADQLSGGADANVLFGGAGNDGLYGKEGDDVLNGGAGADALSGWLGFDMASYADSTGQVGIDLATGAGNGGEATGDTLSSIEGVVGSDFNDGLLGDAEDNVLRGGAGNDTLGGRAGDDVLHGGMGADVLSGYDGVDLATWFDSAAGVTVSLNTTTGQGGDAAGDTLSGIENLEGSAFNDTLYGNALGNVLTGNAGTDLLGGGDGDDILDGGLGADTLRGDAGFDMASYDDSIGQVGVDLATGMGNGGEATGDTLSGIEGVIGSDFNDGLAGDAEDNELHGGAGNDTLGGRGGDDVLHGGAGADVLAGQDGVDLATWFDSAAGVTISLNTNTGQGGDAAGDTLSSIENLEGSAFADTLYGNTGDNLLIGAAGNDTLGGGDGDDILNGGLGVDVLSGGNGFDIATYVDSDLAVEVILAAGKGYGGEAHGDTIAGVEGLIGSAFGDVLVGDNRDNFFEGGNGADTLVGGGGFDTASYADSLSQVTVDLITGGSGGEAAGDRLSGIEEVIGSAFNDNLSGDSGSNVLHGRNGDDTLKGWAGDDILHGGVGADALDGSAGIDRATWYDATSAVTASLNSNTFSGGAAGDTLAGIEDLEGSEFSDTLYGNVGANLLIGLAGADTIGGGDGNDILNGGLGADTLSGGNGFDIVTYVDSAAAVSIDLSAGTGAGGEAAGDTLASIEEVIGSSYDDSLAGNAGANALHGRAGLDTLSGRDGSDILDGGAGADQLDGGAGNDTATYADSAAAVNVNLAAGAGYSGDATGDTLIGIENVIGSAGDDWLRGDGTANALFGNDGIDTIQAAAGDDQIIGGAGDDKLSGEDGNDGLSGGIGADILNGGSGADTASYVDSAAAVNVSLVDGKGYSGDAAGDALAGIENVTGSAGADWLRGNDLANILIGMAGIDTLAGNGGDDMLIGGTGADKLDGGAGSDTASYRDSAAGVTISLTSLTFQGGEAQGDLLQNIENLAGSSFGDTLYGDAGANVLYGLLGNDVLGGHGGNDTVIGDEGADSLSGADGNDLLWGGKGADTLSGGAGLDVATYSDSAYAVNVNLADGAGYSGDANGDALSGIENVVGSNGADWLRGDGNANGLYGGIGVDTIQGAGGNDYVVGGAGDDKLHGEDGNDTIWGEDGADDLYGGNGDDILIGGASGSDADHLDGGAGWDFASYTESYDKVYVDLTQGKGFWSESAGDTYAGIEEVWGSQFDDTLIGSGVNNTLRSGNGNDIVSGREGNDTLLGGAGADNLAGGDGDDTLNGGAGADYLDGGTGWNFASYIDASSAIYADLAQAKGFWGEAQGDAFANIDEVWGSRFNDTIYGSSAVQTLRGADGNDILRGAGGADTLDGGAGWDIAVYTEDGAGVSVDLNTGQGLRGNAQGDRLYGIEEVQGGGGGDSLLGDAGGNVLRGYDGNDFLHGGWGGDTLDGGGGWDWLSYKASGGAVYVDLSTGHGSWSDAEGDLLSGFEGVEGSQGNDTLKGDGGSNRIAGLGGSDMLYGNGGGDAFVYYATSDSATGARDKIMDHTEANASADHDWLDLSAIDANTTVAGNQGFDFADTYENRDAAFGVFRQAGRLAAWRDGDTTMVGGDVDGDGDTDFEIEIVGRRYGGMDSADFNL